MTRQEFIDGITCMSELIEFCSSVDCDVLCDVYDSDERDNYINEELLADWTRECTWQQVLDILSDIPTGYEYYYYDGDWYGIDEYSEFDDWKNQVLAWCDEEGDVFEEEETEPEDEPDPDYDPDDQYEIDCSISDFLKGAYDSVQTDLLRVPVTHKEVPERPPCPW